MRFSGASFVGPLDDYTSGLKIAWDVRRRLLSSYTGPLFEVRADRSGQPTFDVPFKADGTWDTDALLSFAGSDSCYVTQVYPQIGSIVFAQETAANQPRIVNAGVLEQNGARMDGRILTQNINPWDIFGGSGTVMQVVSKCRLNTGDTGGGYWAFGATQAGAYVNAFGGIYSDLPETDARVVGAQMSADADHVISQERSGANVSLRVDGSVTASRTDATGAFAEGATTFDIATRQGNSFGGWISTWCIWDNTTDAAGRAAALA